MQRSVILFGSSLLYFNPSFQTAEGEGEVFRRISEYGGFLVGLSLVAVGVRRDAQGIMVCPLVASVF